jgi:hypothetical protein
MHARSHAVQPARLLLILLLAFGLAALLGLARPGGAGAASGKLLWAHQWDSPLHNSENFRNSVQGPNGTVYVTGKTNASFGPTSDIGLFDFRQAASAGTSLVWQKVWNNSVENGSDFPHALTADANGNAIVAGQTTSATTGLDWVVVKRSRTGAFKWSATFDGGHSGQSDWVNGMACDRAGNVYVSGTAVIADGVSEWVVCKFRAKDGYRLWAYRYAGTALPQLYNEAIAIAVDAAGNSYVTGQVDGVSAAGDAAVMRIDTSGHRKWLRSINDAYNGVDSGTEIALRGGALYVGGQIEGAGTTPNVLLARYTTGGTRLWLRAWAGSNVSKGTWANDMTVDGHGNAVLAGNMWLSPTDDKAIVVSWSPNGHLRWSRMYWRATTRYAEIYSVVADANGNVWAGGIVNWVPGVGDALLMRLRPNGAVKWVKHYDGDAHSDDWFSTLTLWGKSSLFAGGTAVTTLGDDNALAARYVR